MHTLAEQVFAAVLVALVLVVLGWIGRAVRRWALDLLAQLTEIATLPAAVDRLADLVAGHETRISNLEHPQGVTT